MSPHVEAELFTDGGNDAVVCLPGRRFPALLTRYSTALEEHQIQRPY
ncbi:DUF6959 family protein [Streptomyces sp. NPDC059466]